MISIGSIFDYIEDSRATAVEYRNSYIHQPHKYVLVTPGRVMLITNDKELAIYQNQFDLVIDIVRERKEQVYVPKKKDLQAIIVDDMHRALDSLV
jgi:hypothetical protein